VHPLPIYEENHQENCERGKSGKAQRIKSETLPYS
jgi:hypothetical protein